MLKIAICDDDYHILSQLENYLLEIKEVEKLDLDVEVFSDGELLRKELANGTIYDIIYMDIQMKGESGITTVQEIRKTDDATLIIYISSYEQYAIELFPLDVFYFMKKPINKEDFRRVFLSASQKLADQNRYFAYSYKNCEYKYPYKEIVYFESQGRKVYLHLKNGEKPFFNGKLSEIESELSGEKVQFLRVHQSYLVNYHHIVAKSRKAVVLSNEVTLQISEERQKEFSMQYAQLLEDELHV